MVKELRVEAGGLQIFLIEKKPEKPVSEDLVLFIHGYPDNHKTWEAQMNTLSKKYRTVALDLPGTGASQEPKTRSGYHIDNILPVIASVIDALEPKGKVHLVAHDWGAIISWVFVSRPEYAKKLASYTAIAGPHPAMAKQNMLNKLLSLDPDRLEEFVRQAYSSWYIFLFQIPFIPELMWSIAPRQLWKRAMRSGGVPEYDKAFDISDDEIRRQSTRPVNLYRELLQGSQIEIPERINLPVQVIVPRHDFAITPEIYDNLAEFVPGILIRSVAANHWVHRERPDTVSRMLEEFFSNLH